MKIHERILGVEEFLAVAEHGSFVAAAEILGLTPSGVGKAVQRLEARLGVRLFTRTTRRVQLTEDGALFRERCLSLVRDLDAAEGEVDARRSAVEGLIRLNAPVAYGRLKILPHVIEFMQRNKGVRVEAQLTDRLSHPIEDRIDLLVRIGKLEDSGMWARQIDNVRFGLYSSPAYLKKYGTPRSALDVAQHVRLGFVLNSGKPLNFHLQSKSHDHEHINLPPNDLFLSTDIEATLTACELGLGLAYLPTFIAKQAVDRKALISVLPKLWVDGPPVHLVCPQPRQVPRRVRALADFIAAAFSEQTSSQRAAN